VPNFRLEVTLWNLKLKIPPGNASFFPEKLFEKLLFLVHRFSFKGFKYHSWKIEKGALVSL